METQTTSPTSYDAQLGVFNPIGKPEGVEANLDPLTLDIPDNELVKIINTRLERSKQFFDDKYNLTERRKKNEMYLFGRQLGEKEKQKELKKYEARFLDNVIYEIESSLKPLAMSHLPDMIVLPGTNDKDKEEMAKNLSLVVNDTNKQRVQRKVLALGFKHLPVYFTACLKVVWDSTIQDFKFIIIHPDRITVDQTAKTNDVNEMEFIAESVPSNVQEMFMKFPNKKDDLKEELIKHGVKLSDKPDWKELASEVDYLEIHFSWYKQKTEEEKNKIMDSLSVLEPGIKWKKIECIVWKYEDVILDKMLDPNFDWEGEEILTVQTDPNDPNSKKELKPEDMMALMVQGNYQGISREKIYHNYFNFAEKPYFFFGYDQWGKSYIDETSRIEQNIRNQANLDDQGKRIVEKLKQRVKHIWSKDSGLDSAAVQKMDLENPNLDALVEGKVNEVHEGIQPERPDAAEYKSILDTRERMYGIAGANAIRGQVQSDTATSNQIAREADFTRADDLVEDTINTASEWMARWQMQFIKLRYTENKLRQIIGSKGHVTFVKLRRDYISDGMEVTIKSSSTDKLKAQNNALRVAQLGAPYSNPLDFFKDMGMDDPEGRTERGILVTADPAGYLAKYILKLDSTQAQADALNATPPAPQAPPQAVPPPQANTINPPQNPQPTDTTTINTNPPTVPQGSPQMA